MELNEISEKIIGAAIKVHRTLGYRLDILVEDAVIVELKAVTTVTPLHEAQLLSYLKLSGKHPGLLINFNVTLLKNGITRRIN